MTKDKDLEAMFLTQKPHFEDADTFMASLTKRLDAVEYIKQYQEATMRRCKMAMVAAFIVGVISGAIGILYVLSVPADAPLFTFHVQTGFLRWLAENSRTIVTMALSLLVSFGLLSIMANVQDIVNMRKEGVMLSTKSLW